jgi:hypothetical protein
LHKPVKMSPAQIEAQIQRQDAEPFQELLALVLGAQPTDEALKEFADRAPDRWVRVIAMFANLAGFQAGRRSVRQRGRMRTARRPEAP